MTPFGGCFQRRRVACHCLCLSFDILSVVFQEWRSLVNLAGVASFGCRCSMQEFTCYVAGLASPTRRSHLRLDDRRAARSALEPLYKPSAEPDRAALHPFGSIQPVRERSTRSEGVESSRSGVTPHRQQALSRIWRSTTSSAAFHKPRPRSTVPVTSSCTRYVAVHPIRRGVMPTDRVHRLIDNNLARGFSRLRRPRRSPTGPGRAALH